MSRSKSTSLIVLVITIIAMTAASASAAPVVLKVGWAETADPFGHQTSAALAVFESYVERESQGEIQVELYPGGQLGDAASLLEQTRRGIIQACGSVPSGSLAGTYYPNFYAFDVPFLFSSDAVAWRVLEPRSPFVQAISDDMAAETGVRLLTFFVEGQRHFTNNVREIRSPEDLKGLKIRTMEVPAHMEMMRVMGASPTPVSWLELYSALQTGVVDGQENPISNILYLQADQVQRYLTLDGHITLLNTLLINERFYQGLTEDQRRIIDEAVEVAAVTNRGMSALFDATGIQELQDRGMQVYTLSAEERARFVEVTQGPVIDFIRAEMSDPTWLDRLLDAVAEAEAALGR